ncbi:hypothetical protein [uncultured Ruegeria sp.]|uniref:hypothetical protein n=1 Tax=uncultured Ruegeria sp. TaxID=259304 RepID=UPI00261325A6|nr:hypothetical protein [uncultured Ruegeria sp.]
MTGFGQMRSRAGADLRYTSADAELTFNKWSRDKSVPKDAHVLLIEPSVADFASACTKVSKVLSGYPQQDTGVDLYFAGHGLPGNGALVLSDGVVTATRLIGLLEDSLKPGEGLRGLSMLLDSCFSGAFLFEAMVALQNHEKLRLFDAQCSSMHDEKSWELSFLGHGAFTFTHFHKGNNYVDSQELADAIDRQDNRTIARCVQGLVGMTADPAAFLTQGRQHSIDCMKGNFIDAGTRGLFDITDVDGALSVQLIVDGLGNSGAKEVN